MNSMRNLEKLGILVIVILVVVVGVVAITPRGRVDRALELADGPDAVFPVRERLDVATKPPVEMAPPPEAWPPEYLPEGATTKAPVTTRGPATPTKELPPLPPATETRRRDVGSERRIERPVAPPPRQRFREYVVRKDDNFYDIAKREMGSPRHLSKLLAANPTVNPDRMRIGATIKIPILDGASTTSTAAIETTPARRASAPRRTAPGGSYVVRGGDTLSGIASVKLGSAARWHEIARLNEQLLGGSDVIREGMRLRLPGGADEGTTRLRNPAPESGARYYVVRKGESLSAIARRELGNESRWREIVKLNSRTIRDPDSVIAGTRLRLPAR